MAIDKKVLKAAAAELRKELRAHGGRSLMPKEGSPKEEAGEKPKEEEAEDAKKKRP